MATDATHNPALTSWLADANNHPDFPIQNLPLGIFSPPNGDKRPGIAIGDHILDLGACLKRGLLTGDVAAVAEIATGDTLNAFMARGKGPRTGLRAAVSALLAKGSRAEDYAPHILHPANACTLHLPAAIGDYTDFYAGIHHAVAIGKLFRPDAPLLPNYKHVPIGYHGRASSITASGESFRRPKGQIKPPADTEPRFAPTARLDFELEFGIWIGPGNAPGDPIDIATAADHIAGYCLLNDWSARDIQAWEYQPLGPFLAKSFATTISPWIVTPEALAPFRHPQPQRPDGDPHPLPYLWNATDQQQGAFDITLEVHLTTQSMRQAAAPPFKLSHSNTLHAYWTAAQLLTHHASNGCNLRPGDLFGSGTLSGPAQNERGSLMELTENGRTPITLPNGETRTFLLDGDTITLSAHAAAPGVPRIGFGPCSATVLPAHD